MLVKTKNLKDNISVVNWNLNLFLKELWQKSSELVVQEFLDIIRELVLALFFNTVVSQLNIIQMVKLLQLNRLQEKLRILMAKIICLKNQSQVIIHLSKPGGQMSLVIFNLENQQEISIKMLLLQEKFALLKLKKSYQ